MATEEIALRIINICLQKNTQITDFSTENLSQRLKQFTGHVINVNMFDRKRKQANIFRENTILLDRRNTWQRHAIVRFENNLTFSANLTLEIPSNAPQSFPLSSPKPVA